MNETRSSRSTSPLTRTSRSLISTTSPGPATCVEERPSRTIGRPFLLKIAPYFISGRPYDVREGRENQKSPEVPRFLDAAGDDALHEDLARAPLGVEARRLAPPPRALRVVLALQLQRGLGRPEQDDLAGLRWW